MSIAIVPDLHDQVKLYAKRKGQSTSEYVGNLIEQAVALNIDDDPMVIGKPIDEEVKPVILKIPESLMSDTEQLKKWLAAQMGGILRAVSKKTEPEQQ
jgi:hypothetical protein